MAHNVLPHHAAATSTLSMNVRAVEHTQLLKLNIASPLPYQMSARRGAACYAQAKFYIESRFATQNQSQQDHLQLTHLQI